MKGVIDSGRIGKLKSLVIHQTGSLFNTASHCLDLLMRLNSDHPASWVRAYLTSGADAIEGDVLKADPVGQGTIQFENGVTAYALNSGRGLEVEAIGDVGVVTGLQNGEDWQVREVVDHDHRGRNVLGLGEFPKVERTSSTVHLIEDLVHALDTGEPTRCGVKLAHANQELIFAFVESHQRGGARVDLPLKDCPYRLDRNSAPRQPKFERE
jgi:predicted dehydrogenase